MGLPHPLQVLLPLGLQLEREDLSLDMHKREIGMTQTKGEANLTPAHWAGNHTDPAKNGTMRGKDQATLLTGQALTFEEFSRCSEMLISKHAN